MLLPRLFQTKDQLMNMKQIQWAFSSSFNTFHATALSNETGLPMLDKQIPPWRHIKPCSQDQTKKNNISNFSNNTSTGLPRVNIIYAEGIFLNI